MRPSFKKITTLLLFTFPVLMLSLKAQYAHYTFYSDEGTGFHLSAKGKDVFEGYATNVTIRLNQGSKYEFLVSIPGSNGPVTEEKVFVPADGISATFEFKQKGNGTYKFRLKDQNPGAGDRMASQETAPASSGNSDGGNGMTFKMTKTESYSGPDGSYSKKQETEGSLGSGGFESTTTKSSASLDENGFNSEVSQKSTSVGNAANTMNSMGQLAKLARNKKKEDTPSVPVDGKDLVVTDIQYAAGSASSGSPANASQPTENKTPTSASAPATTAQPNISKNTEPPLPPAPALDDLTGIARVPSDLGYQLYHTSEPVMRYEVIFEVSASGRVLTPTWLEESTQELIQEVRETLEKKKYMGQTIDALISENGVDAKAVRFIENGNENYGRVITHDDKELYLKALPTRKYEVVGEFDNSKARGSSAQTGFQLKKSLWRIGKEFPDLEYDAIITDDLFSIRMIRFVE